MCIFKKIFHKKLIAIIVILAILFSFPLSLLDYTKAFAYTTSKTYTWKNTLNAQINTDGSVIVHEQRIIDITDFVNKAKKYHTPALITPEDDAIEAREKQNSHLNALAWSFGSFPEESETSINDMKIGIIDASDNLIGNWTSIPFSGYDHKWDGNNSPANSLCSFDDKDREVCMFNELVSADKITSRRASETFKLMTGLDCSLYSTNKAIINFDYTIKRAPVIFKDVADYNWIYESATWPEDSYNVSVSVTIPVGSQSIASPLGKVTSTDVEGSTERNIYAWGHGSSSGVVELDPAGVVRIDNEIVPGGTNASLHIVFPSAWLINLDTGSNQVFINQTKLSSILKDEQVWRDDRTDAVSRMFLQLVFIASCIVLLIITLISFLIYKSKFSNQGILDTSVENLNPAILARLKYYNHEHPEDIVESIIHLVNDGVLKYKRLHSGDYKIIRVRNDVVNEQLNFIDSMTLSLIFDTCACRCSSITLDDLFNFAKVRSKDFMVGYLTWHSILTDDVNQLYHFKSSSDKVRHILFGCAICLIFIAIFMSIIAKSWIALVCGFFTAFVIGAVANTLRNKIYFRDKSDDKKEAADIFDSIAVKDDNSLEFKNVLESVIRDAVLTAQDNVHK